MRQSQLRQQVESLREENQRLDKLVQQQQKAGTSPAEKARTPRAKGSERQTPQDMGEAQGEIAQLRGWIQQLQQEAQMAQEELEAARREGWMLSIPIILWWELKQAVYEPWPHDKSISKDFTTRNEIYNYTMSYCFYVCLILFLVVH